MFVAQSGLLGSVNFVRRHAFIISLVIVGGVIRFAILFLSQRHVMSDEAIVGLMAKHILEGHNFPFYLYGVSYSGSGAWLFDPLTETLERIAYVSGYGLTAWLAD